MVGYDYIITHFDLLPLHKIIKIDDFDFLFNTLII